MRLPRPLIGTFFLAATCTLASCADRTLPPQGQVVLYMDTDAPVTALASTPGSTLEKVPLFDRMLVEIFEPDNKTPCSGCVRDFVLDADKMRQGKFSFGFAPPARRIGYKVRLRMFRSRGGLGPRRASSVELVGFMPAVAEDGITELTATFRTDDVGAPRGTLGAPVVFERGAPRASLEGSWPRAAVRDCDGNAPAPNAVCVAGGAFFMGDPRITTDGTGGAAEHLVIVAPFFLDAHEVTVGELRASGLADVDSRGRVNDPTDDTNDLLGGQCDYSASPGAWEDRPVDCVSWELASKYCAARGGHLPTEAEFELVASLRGTRLHPWGDDDPRCDEAVVIRDLQKTEGGCAEPSWQGGRLLPEPSGHGARDQVILPRGMLFDLGANLSEWASDDFALDTHACWSGAILDNPVCRFDGATNRSAKSGSLDTTRPSEVQVREPHVSVGSAHVGFRCAYAGVAK